jgi:hypothetical protein
MRIHRIELRDYRGVVAAEVAFPSTGVTIVEGDNEVGKTSLAEALDLLLTAPDSSKSSRVRAVQPVHRDVGPEVVAELSTGPYRFVYSKRWHRRPETTLELLAPRHEHVRGREAHQRVEAILAETLDRDLWDALRLHQAGELAQPRFHVASLGRALDAAVGAERAGDREDHLWEAICAERDRYWTATGLPKGDRSARSAAVEVARGRVEALESQLRALDADAEEVARLDVEIAGLEARLREQASAEEELSAEVSTVERLRIELDRLSSAGDAASADVARLRALSERRAELVDDVRARRDEVAKREEEAARATPARAAAEAHLAAVRAEADRARAAWQAADAAHQLAVADADHRRREIEVEQLTERRDRVVAARARHATAEATLAAATVDPDVVAGIEEAHLAVVRAEAVATAGAASLEIAALAELCVEVAGEEQLLAPGSTSTHRVADELVARVPGVAEVRIRAGEESRALAGRLADAQAELRRRCDAARVSGLDEARRLAADREAAVRDRAEAAEAVRRDLRDLSLDSLGQKVERLEQKVAEYRRARGEVPPLPPDLGAAQAHVADTERRLDGLAEESEQADRLAKVAESAVFDAISDDAGLGIVLDQARLAAERAERALEAARRELPDPDLAAQLADATGREGAAIAAVASARAALEAADPATLEVRVGNARAARTRTATQLATDRERRRELRVKLDLVGEQGLAQQLDDATSELRHLERDHERTERRAAAALLLHDTFARRRDAARDTYSAPFRERIEGLGRIVWGPSFAVELDDELRIARRTLDGVTVEFDDLSSGAKEQLGILARLACASIVAVDGGAPVIIDDALGWTDPHRLERIGAAIAVAGRTCQVIVLTCTPGRYASVGEASVVRLTPAV